MSSSEHSETSPPTNEAATTGIQTPPPLPSSSEADSIALPPLPQPPRAAVRFVRLCAWLDVLLVAVVLLFAFLVALFPVTNPDFFRQLATGRMLAHGEYAFGVDPFVYTGEGYYVNHSWLFGLLLYGLYQLPALGGVAVVVFKALLIVVLAELLLRVSRRPRQSLWIPAVCTMLAILVVSPRLYLQPPCLSYLFLGLTLWVLTTGKRWWWLLPPLFALWVNCDAWFVLGPLTVALYLGGELLQRLQGGEPTALAAGSDARKLGIVLLVGIAACLINPHHYHALSLPPEFGLTSAGDLIERDSQFSTLFLSPLRKEYYEPVLGGSVAGVAYWPLLLLGLLSFVMVYGRVPWWRLAVWLGFALMSLYNMRAIPFFAIVGAPLAALNWLDYAAHRLGETPPSTKAQRNWSLGGRAGTLLLGGLLLLASLPGWLQAKSGDAAQPYKNRCLGWDVRVDPALEAMAETIRSWREAGRIGDEPAPHWFNMHHEIADYLAWYGPGERVFLDRAMPHFRAAADDYVAFRQAMDELANESPSAEGVRLSLEQIRRILRKYRVHYWIFDNNARRKADLAARYMLFTRPQEWILCALKGRIAIFAWRDPQPPTPTHPDPALKLALNLSRAAFGPDAEPAPATAPDPTPSTPPWWQAWWRPLSKPSFDRETAALEDLLFQAREQPRQMLQEYQRARAWQTATAVLAIPLALPNGPLPNNLLALNWSWAYHDLLPPGTLQPVRAPREVEKSALHALRAYLSTQPEDPPATLYLGLRAARRAVRANPEDAFSYFLLSQVYRRLNEQRLEQALLKSVNGTAEIRRTQLTAALQSFLRLQPDHDNAADAHETLFFIYLQLDFLDAAVHHLRHLVAKRNVRRPANVAPEQYKQTLERMSAELKRLETKLGDRQNSFDVNSVRKTGLEKVKVAMELRLTDTALAALEEFAQEKEITLDPNQQRIIKQVTTMALDLGRLDKARELLPDREKRGGKPVHLDSVDLYVRLAAAQGNYEEADRLLSEAVSRAWQPAQTRAKASDQLVPLTADRLSRILLVPNQLPPWDFMLRRWYLEAIKYGMIESQLPAQWTLTRGWLTLECGQNREARKQLQSVRDMTVTGEKWIKEVNETKAWWNPQQEIPELQKVGFFHAVAHDLSLQYLKWLEQ